MRKVICSGAVILALAGCGELQAPFADDATVAAVSYRDPGPASITLYTMVNNRTGDGGHSALLINASERIIFDPAGSFYADVVPERNDVLFGITPEIEKAYRSAHARTTYHVRRQTIPVTAEQAEVAYRLALQNGAVAKAFCTNATSGLLRSVPGFEKINLTFWPTALSKQVAKLDGVTEDLYYETDDPDLQKALAEGNAELLRKRKN